MKPSDVLKKDKDRGTSIEMYCAERRQPYGPTPCCPCQGFRYPSYI